MSTQTITDILVSSQAAEFQISKNTNESQSNSSSISFMDMISSYQETSEPVKNQAEKPVEHVEKTEDSKIQSENSEKSEDLDKISENKSEEKNPEEKKIEDKAEKKTDATEKSSPKTNLNKTETEKTSNSKDEKIEVKQEKAKVKENPKAKKEQKLDEKDFARIAELENEAEKNVQPVNVKQISEKETAKSKDSSENNDELLIVERNDTENLQIAVSEGKENSDVDFKFDDHSSKKENVSKLDKEGKITVEDLRTEKSVETEGSKKQELKVTDVKYNNENTATITMDLNQADANVLSLNDQSAASQGSNFQSMLNNQIQANVPEFVKAGNIILKDNDQGTINLVLHPDDLGNVKIHLSMDGKSVTGHITVATKEALQVFKDNSETLREAFIKSGFESANFDVAYGNGGSGSQNMNFEQQNDGTAWIAKQVYNSSSNGESLDSMLDNFIGNEENFENFSINIVA